VIGRDWPRRPSLGASFCCEVVSLAVPGSAWAIPHTTDLLEAVWGQVRLHERVLGCIFVAVTHGARFVPLEVQAVILTDMQPSQLFV